MPSIRKNFDPKIGPIITLGIAKPNPYVPPVVPPHPSLRPYLAVIPDLIRDPGAGRKGATRCVSLPCTRESIVL